MSSSCNLFLVVVKRKSRNRFVSVMKDARFENRDNYRYRRRRRFMRWLQLRSTAARLNMRLVCDARKTQGRTQAGGGVQGSCPQWLHDNPQSTISVSGEATLRAKNVGNLLAVRAPPRTPLGCSQRSPNPLDGGEGACCTPLESRAAVESQSRRRCNRCINERAYTNFQVI